MRGFVLGRRRRMWGLKRDSGVGCKVGDGSYGVWA